MIESQPDKMTGLQTLHYGSEQIDFNLQFSPRSRLSIVVEPNGNIAVKAPVDAELDAVHDQVRLKAGWIIRQRDRFAEFGPTMPPKQYRNGETHRYLGRQYRLRITSGKPSVKLIGRFFELVTPDKSDAGRVQKQLDAWYRGHATNIFGECLQRWLKSSHFRHLNPPSFTLRKMSLRWGSCTNTGAILLNPVLVEQSPRCIEYVIAHELCHLIHYSHDSAFYRLLNRVMPDWHSRKALLEIG